MEPLPAYADDSSLLSCEHKNTAPLYAAMNALIVPPEVALHLKSVAKTARGHRQNDKRLQIRPRKMSP